MISNLETAKELLEKYKSITLEQLEEAYEEIYDEVDLEVNGYIVMNKITGFGKDVTCILCLAANSKCEDCIYSFRFQKDNVPCLDEIYDEMSDAVSAKGLFAAIQKRISYLTHIIKWYENSN